LLNNKYENFKMKNDETIDQMFTYFSEIANNLASLRKVKVVY